MRHQIRHLQQVCLASFKRAPSASLLPAASPRSAGMDAEVAAAHQQASPSRAGSPRRMRSPSLHGSVHPEVSLRQGAAEAEHARRRAQALAPNELELQGSQRFALASAAPARLVRLLGGSLSSPARGFALLGVSLGTQPDFDSMSASPAIASMVRLLCVSLRCRRLLPDAGSQGGAGHTNLQACLATMVVCTSMLSDGMIQATLRLGQSQQIWQGELDAHILLSGRVLQPLQPQTGDTKAHTLPVRHTSRPNPHGIP